MSDRVLFESQLRTPDGITVSVTVTVPPALVERADPSIGEVLGRQAEHVTEAVRLALKPPPF